MNFIEVKEYIEGMTDESTIEMAIDCITRQQAADEFMVLMLCLLGEQLKMLKGE